MKITVSMIQVARRAEHDYHQTNQTTRAKRSISTPDAVIQVMLEAALTHAEGTTLQPLRTGQSARLQRAFNPLIS